MNQIAIVARNVGMRALLGVCGIGLALSVSGPAFGSPESGTCSSNPESRQMDYWLGDWSIGGAGASSSASSKVFLELDKCMIVESWDGGRGHTGQNMFAYSSDDKKWHGMFADNEGRVHVFEGTIAAGSAEFIGPSRGPNGEADLNRVRIVRVSPDKVEQIWEKSSDGGGTWKLAFRGEYDRKKP